MFKRWLCESWCGILGFLFADVVPILSFGGVVAYHRTVTAFELTVFGYGALVLLGLVVLGKSKKRVEAMSHSVKRGLLLSLYTALLWIAGFGVLYFGLRMVQKLLTWWIFVGVCFLVGRVFYLLDEVKRSI